MTLEVIKGHIYTNTYHNFQQKKCQNIVILKINLNFQIKFNFNV